MGAKSPHRVAVLAGDGIGPEVMAEAIRVLHALEGRLDVCFEFREGLIGGAAYDAYGLHFPKETERICRESEAILLGAVGGPPDERYLPKWERCEVNSILALRRSFQFSVNFRPVRVFPALSEISPLRPERLRRGVDLLIVRELLGDVYFGEHTSTRRNGKRIARDNGEYTEDEIASVAHRAFQAARLRRRRVTSVDKANVLEMSRLWRSVVDEVRASYPDVECEHMLVDSCAMQIVLNPAHFDVLLTANLFGDILSDLAAALQGSLGLLPSASLNNEGFGLYEPAGGSATDIAGQQLANPIAQILSAAMMLEFSFGLTEGARAIESAIEACLSEGSRTRDMSTDGSQVLSTREMGQAIIDHL